MLIFSDFSHCTVTLGFAGSPVVKNLPANAGDAETWV